MRRDWPIANLRREHSELEISFTTLDYPCISNTGQIHGVLQRIVATECSVVSYTPTILLLESAHDLVKSFDSAESVRIAIFSTI
jgi:hypothetical protein